MGTRLTRNTATKIVSVGLPAVSLGLRTLSATVLALGLSSCALFQPSVIETAGDAPPPVEASVPGYAAVPHPLGLQIGDVAALFLAPDAPKRDSDEMKTCTSDFVALAKKTGSRDELKQGLLELVRKEPIRYHWCFYGTILELENHLRKAEMLDERQRAVVDAYRFLAPLSRVFYREYHDSRYLRWAVSYYRRASELAFYRRVETSPGLTQELVGAGGDETTRGTPEKATSVLEKYGIVVPERLQPGQHPDAIPKGEALPTDAYVDTGSGVMDAASRPAEPERAPAAEAPRVAAPVDAAVFPASDAPSN
jgi:hypothetical protein